MLIAFCAFGAVHNWCAGQPRLSVCPCVKSLPTGRQACPPLEGNHDFRLRPSHQIGNGVKREMSCLPRTILRPALFVSSRGIEPRFPPSEGGVLSVIRRGRKNPMPDPLNYTIERDRYRIFLCVLGRNFTLLTFLNIYVLLCPWQESNLRPSGPQPDALSTELQGHV